MGIAPRPYFLSRVGLLSLGYRGGEEFSGLVLVRLHVSLQCLGESGFGVEGS